MTRNPFELIYKVFKYVIKTKHPRQRSAFTYWEDNPPLRIDFGKIKYGGPFTTCRTSRRCQDFFPNTWDNSNHNFAYVCEF